jgi:phosphotransferase system enzyme I (PtsI)
MTLKGIPASSGIAIGKLQFLDTPEIQIPTYVIEDLDSELSRLQDAIDHTVSELKAIRNERTSDILENHLDIFDAHIHIATDPELMAQATMNIKVRHMNAAHAWNEAASAFISSFQTIENEYMRERAADIKDVTRRILSNLLHLPMHETTQMNDNAICVVRELVPSLFSNRNMSKVKGIIAKTGGPTSHGAIMARSLGIPLVVGIPDIFEYRNYTDSVILDGDHGVLILHPSIEDFKLYERMQKDRHQEQEVFHSLQHQPSITIDGTQVEITANITNPRDVTLALEEGAEGIGLFRTEFLYMNKPSLPTEEEQFQAYKAILTQMPNKKVVIRTLDIGGDKQLPYLSIREEETSFLGLRGIRLCLNHLEIFIPQLKALLRASVYGNLHIMFPMVTSLDDYRQGKVLLERMKRELRSDGYQIGSYQLGIMVEVPYVTDQAHLFAKEVDFFSIGTNDLIQYTFHIDRMNSEESYIYSPSLFERIKRVIDAGKSEGIWTSVCGELASDPIAALILLGLGLDAFSMNANKILATRHLIRSVSFQDMVKHANHVLSLSSEQEVEAYMKRVLSKYNS